MRFDGANERAYTWECDQAVWANLREGQSYRLRISASGVPLRLER
ncbi:MAG: hypothetical protein OHK0022_45990 [Roseiflexaceae bacterium]